MGEPLIILLIGWKTKTCDKLTDAPSDRPSDNSDSKFLSWFTARKGWLFHQGTSSQIRHADGHMLRQALSLTPDHPTCPLLAGHRRKCHFVAFVIFKKHIKSCSNGWLESDSTIFLSCWAPSFFKHRKIFYTPNTHSFLLTLPVPQQELPNLWPLAEMDLCSCSEVSQQAGAGPSNPRWTTSYLRISLSLISVFKHCIILKYILFNPCSTNRIEDMCLAVKEKQNTTYSWQLTSSAQK